MRYVLIRAINRLCYLYTKLYYKEALKKDTTPREFGGGGLINDIGFTIVVRKYGRHIKEE